MTKFQKNATLLRRFAWAARGLWLVVVTQANMRLHLAAIALVVTVGWWLEVALWEWLVLVACMAAVTVVECLNSALETLAPAVTEERDERIRDALDISAGAVATPSSSNNRTRFG